MIRRDFLIRMVDQCVQALTRSLRLIDERQFDAARSELDQVARELTGVDLDQVLGMSDAELTAGLLAQGGPTQEVQQRGMLLVALLRRAGDNLAAQLRRAESRACYLKTLNLQLQILAREGPFDFPEFVPRVEELVGLLGADSLPVETAFALLQHYESVGDYARAEDALFAMLEAQPEESRLCGLAVQFYERLLRQDDEALLRGNLPRDEVESGLAEIQGRLGHS